MRNIKIPNKTNSPSQGNESSFFKSKNPFIEKSKSALLVASVAASVYSNSYAQDTSSDTEANSVYSTIAKALQDGKPLFNARLRYETGDIEGLDVSHALTIRTRIGYQTASFYNFNVLVEGEHTSSIIPDHNYSAPGQIVPGKTIIADPEGSEINQAYLGYSNFNTVFKAGRQRIVYDNARFIGDVIWRQAQQTYDAISLANTSIDDLTVQYAYISQVNRITYSSWDSDSHVFNVNYTGLPNMKIAGYSYLLSFDSALANSTDTFGLYVEGALPTPKDYSLTYRAEYAFQEDGRNSPLDYSANYYTLALNGAYKKYSAGVGYEVLGSDGGTAAFRTPLATLHKFNGWADTFLATPAGGIQDVYAYVGYKFGKVPVKVVYHNFSADEGGGDYGNEIDALATYKINDNWGLVAKYAYFMGSGTRPDVQRFSFEVNWKL